MLALQQSLCYIDKVLQAIYFLIATGTIISTIKGWIWLISKINLLIEKLASWRQKKATNRTKQRSKGIWLISKIKSLTKKRPRRKTNTNRKSTNRARKKKD